MSDVCQQLGLFNSSVSEEPADPWEQKHEDRASRFSWSAAWDAMSDQEQRAAWDSIWYRGDPDYSALRKSRHTVSGQRGYRKKGTIDPLLTFMAKLYEGLGAEEDNWQNWLSWRVIDPLARAAP